MGPSCPPTEPSTRRATAKKPYESFPRCGNDDRLQGETPRRRHSNERPPTLRAIPRPLQGLRDRRRGPRDFRTEDEVSPPRAQGRVLLFEMGVHGRQRRGRAPRGLDALPADGKAAGHLSRRRARAPPRPPVPGREGALPGRLQLPRCAHRDRGVQGLHRGRAAARDDGPGAVQVPESRVDGPGRVAPARAECWSESPDEASWPPKTVGLPPDPRILGDGWKFLWPGGSDPGSYSYLTITRGTTRRRSAGAAASSAAAAS